VHIALRCLTNPIPYFYIHLITGGRWVAMTLTIRIDFFLFFSLCSYSKIKVSSFIHIYNENIYTHLLWSTFQSHFSTDLYHWGLKIHTRDLCCQCIYSKTIHKQNRLFFYRQTSRMARSDNFLPLDGVGVFRKKYYKSLFSWQTTLDFIKKHFKKYIAIPNNLQIDIETPRSLFFF